LAVAIVFKLRQITTSSELAEELNISASGSFRAQFGKASAKASYASQQNINRFSVYLLVQVLVTNPVERMRDVKLTAEAWDLLETKGEEEFRERRGDEFLSGITTGGEYLAILQITTRSEEERKNVSASVRAKGGTWRAGADFKFALEKISEEQEIEVTSFQQGGDTTTVPDTLEEILERAVNFPQQVKDKSFPYTAFFQDYSTLDLPSGMMNPIDVANQKRVIEKLADYYLSYSDTLNSIEYVFKNPSQFEDFDAVALNTKANEVRGVLNTLVESASSCFDNYKSCKLPEDLSRPVVDLPTRKSITDGNAPRWVVPKVFGFERPTVFIGPGEMPRDFGFNILAKEEFETYVFDPLGGKVIPLCTGSLKDGVCSQDNYTFQVAVVTIGSSTATRYIFHVPNPEKAPSKTIKITLKSESSGLTSDVELLLVERDQVPDDVTRIFRVDSLGSGVSIIDI
jgi:hypothetical protein